MVVWLTTILLHHWQIYEKKPLPASTYTCSIVSPPVCLAVTLTPVHFSASMDVFTFFFTPVGAINTCECIILWRRRLGGLCCCGWWRGPCLWIHRGDNCDGHQWHGYAHRVICAILSHWGVLRSVGSIIMMVDPTVSMKMLSFFGDNDVSWLHASHGYIYTEIDGFTFCIAFLGFSDQLPSFQCILLPNVLPFTLQNSFFQIYWHFS